MQRFNKRILVRPIVQILFLSSAIWWKSHPAYSLPIGFGTNHGKLKYSLNENQDHAVYHDQRAPNEGAMIQNSLTAAKPVLQQWLGQTLTMGLPVIGSAVSDNASFANFMTNSIELQTMGQGSRDLFWHEYTHTNMYHHFFNWFGPAGSLLHLPWMAAWFIEGLSESMSVSSGSDLQYGIERYQALSGDWPSYDRLHSLYQDQNFSLTGYATSGAFVSWIIRQGNPTQFPAVLDDFYHYTMPWWWPWIAVPFNGFTPINQSIETYAGVGGEELYEKYKSAAESYWKAADSGPMLSAEPGVRKAMSSFSGLSSAGNTTRFILSDSSQKRHFYSGSFDEKTGWLTSTVPGEQVLPDHIGSLAWAANHEWTFAVAKELDLKTGFPIHRIVAQKAGTQEWTTIRQRTGLVYGLYVGGEKLAWYEEKIEQTKVCWLPLNDFKAKATCELVDTMPRSLMVLGQKTKLMPSGVYETEELWLRRSEQTLQGDRYEIIVWNLEANKTKTLSYHNGGKPISLGFAGKQKWLLVAEESGRTLRAVDDYGQCQKVAKIADLPMQITGLESGKLVIGLYQGRIRTVRQLDPQSLKTIDCYPALGHNSPLLYAMNQKTIPSLAAAMAATDPRKPVPVSDTAKNIVNAKPLNTADLPFGGEAALPDQATPAPWRPRPIFLFPFIGAEDPLGTQYGFVSVPLMDHMQDETLRVSVLYGAESRFPNSDITLTSTRYWPTINSTLYRSQTWNGRFRHPNDGLFYSIYMDEKGAKVDSTFRWRFLDQSFSGNFGAKFATLKRYLGPFRVKEGPLNEPNFSLTHFRRFRSFSLLSNVNSRFTFQAFNENFEYNVLGAATTLTYPIDFLDSIFSAGIEGSRTRGKEMRELREVYFPLKTFIPGSGGGYNQNNIPILIGSGSIFGNRFGDTQMRNKLNWTFPLDDDIDKWIGLAYVERLDFTAFVNYGGAWYNGGMPKPEDLFGAHGYNLDLQLENKGIRFNVGLGAGQVFKEDFQVYLTTGFDALF